MPVSDAEVEAGCRAYDPVGWSWYDSVLPPEYDEAKRLFLARQIGCMRAALIAAEAAAWRPIEEAPRDGSKFWGLIDDDAICMFWHPKFSEFVSRFNRITLAAGYTYDDGSTTQDHSPVVHKPKWFRLKPSPPKDPSNG